MSDTTDIGLLAQRLGAAEKLIASQSRRIEDLQESSNKLAGAQEQQARSSQSVGRFVGPVFGGVFALVVGFFGTFILGQIEDNRAAIHKEEVLIAERFERKGQQIAAMKETLVHLEQREEEHIVAPAHAGISIAVAVLEQRLDSMRMPSSPNIKPLELKMENFGTRMKAIEQDLLGDEGKFEDFSSALVSAQAELRTAVAAIGEHEEEIDQLEEVVASEKEGIAAVKASTAAAFVEVETQIRAWIEVANLRASNGNRLMQVLWNKVLPDMPLPDQEFFPTDIPAKATTQVGKVNGS